MEVCLQRYLIFYPHVEAVDDGDRYAPGAERFYYLGANESWCCPLQLKVRLSGSVKIAALKTAILQRNHYMNDTSLSNA